MNEIRNNNKKGPDSMEYAKNVARKAIRTRILGYMKKTRIGGHIPIGFLVKNCTRNKG